MLFLLLISIIIGFLSNFIIYIFCENKLSLKNLFSLNAIKNKFLTSLIIIINMLLYLLLYFKFGKSNLSYIYGIIFSLLVCLAIIDLKKEIVPDSINITIFLISIIFILITKKNIIYHTLGFFLVSVPFFIISILTDGIGGGDIKLFAVTGLFLGAFHIFLAMFFCCLLASIIGLILKHFNKLNMQNNKYSLPLVPYISIGVIISALYGDKILNWYFSKFFY
ncbi:prepilin peptidase [[Clostridium] colinum]|uniref:prepilin peptidase n=1 Tax=[Clostridium] colinum TaxID=36835 RepID=UPI00202510F6|nr:A24 family peptidase [[Clostridium] colinum]